MDYEQLERNRADKTGFGIWLKEELRKQNLSEREFAKRTGISKTQVSRYTHGEQMPTLDLIIKNMAQVLEISIKDMYNKVGLEMPNFDDFIQYLKTKGY